MSEPVVPETVFAQGNVPEESSAGLAEQAPEAAPEPAPLVFVVPPAPAPEVSVEEPAPEPEAPTADVSVAPETARSGGVPEPAGSTCKVVVRLTDGDEVACGSYPTRELAKDAARILAREIGSAPAGEWPELGGRFVRPELIVSVESPAS